MWIKSPRKEQESQPSHAKRLAFFIIIAAFASFVANALTFQTDYLLPQNTKPYTCCKYQ
jgi:hypothetical protein